MAPLILLAVSNILLWHVLVKLTGIISALEKKKEGNENGKREQDRSHQ